MIRDAIVKLIVAFISYLVVTIFHNRLRIKIWLQSILRWNKNIRLSCDYLFKRLYNIYGGGKRNKKIAEIFLNHFINMQMKKRK